MVHVKLAEREQKQGFREKEHTVINPMEAMVVQREDSINIDKKMSLKMQYEK